MNPVVAAVASLCVAFAITTLILVLWWYITRAFIRPLVLADKYTEMMVDTQISTFVAISWRGMRAIPSLLINAAFSMFSLITDNLFFLCCLVILSSASLIWIENHNHVLESYYVVRQCYAQEAINLFLLPTADIVVMLYNSVIGVFDFIMNMNSAAEFLAPLTALKCALNVEIDNLFFYVADAFFAFFGDLNHWVSQGATTAEWNVLNTLRSLGYIIDCLVPIANCFCRALSPLWEAINIFANQMSLHYFINCLLDTAVRLAQVFVVTFKYFISYILPGFNPVRPDFTNATNAACCALYNGGDALEDGVYLLVEAVWGFIGRDLPPELRQFLSVHYGAILSHPLCGVAKIINMTAVVLTNLNDEPNGFLEANGTGIRYLQFGLAADEFKYGARKLGEPFYILNPAAQTFVAQLALCVVDIAAFLLEWLIGNIWFFIFAPESDVLPHYPSPVLTGLIYRILDFLFYYFPNYWLKAPPGGTPVTLGNYTYSSALSDLYDDAMFFSEAAGDLVGLLNNPLGCVIEHLLKSIVTLVSVLCNIISFFMTIFTFETDPATTARAIQTDVFFLELSYTADCLGTLFSQFGNCTVTANDEQDNFFCCLGESITSALDVIIILLQQVVWFVFDILSLPAQAVELCLFGAYNPSRTQCMRIPNLSNAIARADKAIFGLACAIANIVPIFNGFNCIFPAGGGVDYNADQTGSSIGSIFDDFTDIFDNGPLIQGAPCNALTSCIGNVIYSILRIVLVPFIIFNQFFVQLIVGNPITNLFNFLNFSAGLLAKYVGRASDSLAIVVDCAFCAFFNDGVDCGTTFYTLMHFVFVKPLIRVSVSFGLISFYLGRIVMSGLKDIFDGAGFIGLYSIITKSTKLMGIYGEAGVFWFSRVFTKMGMYLVGSSFSATSHGQCAIVEETIDLLVTEIEVFTGGVISVPSIVMCCEASYFCWPFKKRADAEPVEINGTITLIPDTWLKFVLNRYNTTLKWDPQDTCNASMTQYQDTPWAQISEDNRGHLYFCIYKNIWNIRTDNQPMWYMPNSTCDDMITGYSGNDWNSLRPLEKSTISNCIMSRIYINNMRHKANISWFPQDWWTNQYRHYHFGEEIINGMRIYYQYMMDQSTAPSIMITQSYQAAWLGMGLNISHYNGLVTTDDVLLMRTHYHLKDYYVWNNNAIQYDPIEWVTTGFWSFVETLTERAAQTSAAFSDNVTDPTAYLAYEYHTDTPGGVSDGLFFDIISKILSSINSFAKTWSNPNNLKKRATFFADAQKMTSNVYKKLNREVTRMSLEWWKSASHNISIYYGEGEANETIQFMKDYEAALNGLDPSYGKASTLYRIGKWWDNFELPTVKRIPPQKDGKYRLKSLSSNETSTYDRLNGYVNLLRQGSKGANVRWSQLTSGFHLIRNRFYTKVIEKRLEEIRRQHEQKTTYEVQTNGNTVSYNIKARQMVPSNETHHLNSILEEYREKERIHFQQNPPKIAKNRLMDRVYATNALIRVNNLLDLTCISSSSILCAECFFLDQVVGRIEHGIVVTLDYYEGGKYDAMLAQTLDHFSYSLNQSAPCRVGDSEELPVRWPWRYYSNWRIIGDNTPNKLRFNDILNMTNSISDNFAVSIQNSTLYNNIDYGSMNGIVIHILVQWFLPIIDFFYRLALFLFSPTGISDATASLSFVLNSWVVCQWLTGDSINGRFKRFSIGEMLFGYGTAYLGIMIIGTGFFRINFWGIIASTGFAGTIFLFTYLNITYNWAWLCWPSLPFDLFQDVNYFIVHTLLTKCDWLFSGLVKGKYTNSNCVSCEYTLTIEMANCKDYGSRDLLSNIIFFIQYFTPSVLQWLRDTTTPIYILYQIPYINERVNTFVNVNMDDPDIFALYWTCNTTITIIPFLIIGALFWIIFKFFVPLLVVGLFFTDLIFGFLWCLLLLDYTILRAFSLMTQSYPYLFIEDDDDEDDDDEEEEEEDGESVLYNNEYPYYNMNTMMLASDMNINLRKRREHQD